jgi:hypothetical protein
MLAVAALAWVLLVVVGDGHAAPARSATNTATFPDSTGEDAAGPDVISSVVANDDKGGLTFTISVPNRATLTGDMIFLLLLDTDANPASGSADFGGADYIIELDGPLQGPAGSGLFRWNGSDFTASGVPQTTLTFSYANGPAFRISNAELGGTRRFSFGVLAVSGIVLGPDGEPDFTNAHFDSAPDAGHGFYTYDVKITPPTLAVRSSRTQPLRPRAGQRFTAFATVARSDGAPLGGGNVTCRATIAGKSVRAVTFSLVGSRASCTYAIPKTAKGKTIRITVGVTSQGLKATRTFSARIV